ncbi:MAG: OmpH family outer membrane protein [Burkholderiales bacterium]|nr:OmpH family outer membrane protein [Burkholderiales bacterium]
MCILFAGLIMAPALGWAAELKIGFLDAERVNRESAPAIRASKELEREFAPRIQELQKMEKQLKDAQGALEKDALTMSESERGRREQDMGRLSREFQRAQREYREDLNQRRNEKLADLFQRANRVIQQIAEAEKFDLILQEAVYRSPRIDITDKVLKALSGEK